MYDFSNHLQVYPTILTGRNSHSSSTINITYMAIQSYFMLTILLLALDLVTGINVDITPGHHTASLNRRSFPEGFLFGTASAAYQYEGAAAQGGRGPSVWDTFTHKYPDKIMDGSNGDLADDSYHRYKEDVWIIKTMGFDAYRFSISWSRILPNGKLSGGVNKEGIRYYNNLINELLANGIKPSVTLFHWDLPQTLEDEYGGFLSSEIVADFQDYAKICFQEFGDRVKQWVTLNEPWSHAKHGYAEGSFAPGRCSAWQQLNCIGGDSGTEPYLVGHNQLLAHAAAVKLYKQKYQTTQNGAIGIALNSFWFVPFSDSDCHQNATKRALDFMFGWFMDPLTLGDYPRIMKSLVGNRLPKFSKEQSAMLKGSFDFLGLNYYTAYYVACMLNIDVVNASYLTDARANISSFRNGVPIGPKTASDWLYIYPRGIRDILLYIKKKYNDPVIYITENGVCDQFNNESLSINKALDDAMRIDYFYHHLSYLERAIKDGVNVKGYFAWSLLDNFEWESGYTIRFGINYVDYKNGLKRYPKHSMYWFKNFLRTTSRNRRAVH